MQGKQNNIKFSWATGIDKRVTHVKKKKLESALHIGFNI